MKVWRRALLESFVFRSSSRILSTKLADVAKRKDLVLGGLQGLISVFLMIGCLSGAALAQSMTKPAAITGTASLSPALSFGEAYERILARNLDVENQSLNVEISRAKKLSSVGSFTPQLALVGSDTRTAATDVFPTQGRDSAALALSANLFRSGTDFAGLKGAGHDVEASRETLRSEKLKAEDDSVGTLIEFISRTRQRELIGQIVELKTESVKIARERYARGLLAQQEVSKTQIDLDNSQARLIDANVALATARAAVSSRLGAFQNVNLDWPWKTVIVSGARPEQIEFDITHRPDYRASLEALDAESWRRHSSRALLLPSLDLTASYGSYDVSQAGRRDWSTILTLKIPLFDGLAGVSSVRTQNLVQMQAEIARNVVLRTASAEIDSYRVGFVEARESAVAREKTAQLTEKLFSDNQQRFRLGRASADELAIDQNRLLEAKILEVEGWASAHLTLAHLCHALGNSIAADGTCHDVVK